MSDININFGDVINNIENIISCRLMQLALVQIFFNITRRSFVGVATTSGFCLSVCRSLRSHEEHQCALRIRGLL